MRGLVRPLAILFVVAHAGCGDDSKSVAGPSSGGTGGSHQDGGVGGSGGTGWPTGGSGGAAGTGGGSTGGSAGAGGSGGTSGTGGLGGTGAVGATGGTAACGAVGNVTCGTGGPCEFPQGVPDNDFIGTACTYQDTDPSVDAAVNAVMVSLSGCNAGSDCPITTVGGTTTNEICQNWFAAVAQQLRTQGFCAGQHAVGNTDEIAVSNTCCQGKWYGYHICNYGGAKVVWNPGARRGWWMIAPSYCTK